MTSEPQLTDRTARAAMDEAAAAAARPPYPGGHAGRGIVIPGGGPVYFPCAWVAINRLRDLGCTLPIEVWHVGPREMTAEMRELLEPLGVRCVDAAAVRLRHPIRRLFDWEVKPFAAMHSAFREVLLMDADCVATRDPEYLFDAPEYGRTGAAFWADQDPLGPDERVWELTGVSYRDEPSFESCQFLVDKARSWAPLSLAVWMNGHSDFWYRHVYGDKDTFHLAWRRMGVEYAMPPYPLERLAFTNVHRDFDGRVAFLHRCGDKWRLDSPNRHVPGFDGEEACRIHLQQLRDRWVGGPNHPFRLDRADLPTLAVARALALTPWSYRRGGGPPRAMEFGHAGMIVEGVGSDEATWGLDFDGRTHVLTISGESGPTCRLTGAGPDRWLGRSRLGGGEGIELVPLRATPPSRDPRVRAAAGAH